MMFMRKMKGGQVPDSATKVPLPQVVGDIAARLLKINRDERFESARSLIEEIDRVMSRVAGNAVEGASDGDAGGGEGKSGEEKTRILEGHETDRDDRESTGKQESGSVPAENLIENGVIESENG